MKADDRILSAARKAKGCPFQGSSRVRQPWQDLKASRALKTRPFRGPKVRILLPPAASPRTFASPVPGQEFDDAPCRRSAMREPPSR